MLRSKPLLTFAICSICFFASSASRASLITPDAPIVVASGGVAPGSSHNFDFGDFGSNGQPKTLTDYAVSIVAAGQYSGNGGYSSLAAPNGAGPFTSGIAYNAAASGELSLIAAFTPSFNGNFTVYVLDNNTDQNGVGNASISLGVNGGAPVTVATTDLFSTNRFSVFNVTGATSSDVYQVYATRSDRNAVWAASIGGLTFSDNLSAIPEPSSLSLLGIGVSALVSRRKGRKGPVAG